VLFLFDFPLHAIVFLLCYRSHFFSYFNYFQLKYFSLDFPLLMVFSFLVIVVISFRYFLSF